MVVMNNKTNNVVISKDELMHMLKESFDAGYGGYADLRDQTVEGMVEDFFLKTKQRKEEMTKLILDQAAEDAGASVRFESIASSSPSVSGHYVYANNNMNVTEYDNDNANANRQTYFTFAGTSYASGMILPEVSEEELENFRRMCNA